MRRRPLSLATLSLALFGVASTASAQRHYRTGPAMTADGPVYNPALSPEYRLYTQNPAAYEQLMLQRQQQAEAKQNAELVKQQQRFQKWVKDQKAKKDKGQPTDPAYDEMLKVQAAQEAARLKAQAKLDAKRSASKSKKGAAKAKAGSTTTPTPTP